MDDFLKKIEMRSFGKPTNNIDDATLVYIPDEETAEQLSEWSKNNNYPAFVNCEVGWYRWCTATKTFYKE